jgi:hypothetical protein
MTFGADRCFIVMQPASAAADEEQMIVQMSLRSDLGRIGKASKWSVDSRLGSRQRIALTAALVVLL